MNRSDFAKKRKEFDEKTIDELIELLSADDLQTRFFAEMCLRDATSVIEFQTGEFAARERKIYRRMARMAEGTRREI